MSSTLKVVAPTPGKDNDELYDLTGKAFGRHPERGYFDWLKMCRDGYFENSHYDWEASRIGIIDDQIVTHFGVWKYDTRIGKSAVKTAGVGAVATHGDFRKQGLMDITARNCIQGLATAGYDISLLFGLANYYDRFGYRKAWPFTSYNIHLKELLRIQKLHPVKLHALQAFTPSHDTQRANLYNQDHATLTGSAVRPSYPVNSPFCNRKGFQWCRCDMEQSAHSPEGITGYVHVDIREYEGAINVSELCGPVEEVLAALAQISEEHSCLKIEFHRLHALHPLSLLLKRGNCTEEINHERAGGAMVLLVNLKSALQKIEPVLQERWRKSITSGYNGRLLIENSHETVAIELAAGDLRVEETSHGAVSGESTLHAIHGKEELIQLILGAEAPEDIILSSGMSATGDALELASILFPAQRPCLGDWDFF